MKVKILSNPKKQWALEVAAKLTGMLKQANHSIVSKSAEATICIGGDGTILYHHHKGRIQGPILGIGGDKSYVCQLHYKELDKVLPVLNGNMQPVMTLECVVGNDRFRVLNDVVVHATHYRVAELSVAVDNTRAGAFEGDGLIVSSPLGSAAYSYSAGGAQLRPDERKLSIVPICPYRRAFSPLVLQENSKVEITVGSDCALIMDGIFVKRLKKGERVTVTKGPDIRFYDGVGVWR